MAIQGHPRSLISVLIESAYATGCQSSIVWLWSYLAPFQIYRRFSAENSHPTSVPREIWGCSPWARSPMMGLQGKTIIHAITFERTQLIRPRYLNVTDGRTDGWLTIAIPRYAHRSSASRGKNDKSYDVQIRYAQFRDKCNRPCHV